MSVERIFSGILGLVSLGLLYLAWGYVAPIAYDPLGPRPYPVLLLIVLILSCLYLTFRPQKLTEQLDLGYTASVLKKISLMMLFMLLYALTFELLGFPIATALMFFVVGMLFGGSAKASAVSGFVFGCLLYGLFDYVLDVPLPLGFLS
ncbi:tripartite tricarboxylate transporter TctB family protein [Acinetobacter sp. IK40]|jgi:putative tricarboxylic transport membrane protein|uniref:tripartite tricarboxylate transporter TctB family protein n=1 Tax=Acinetobacter sp. IK40 TaxID=2928897 RepID=UPI002D1E9D21|nr:tripartite tricarboxylate transporter TctB family protein [Acinetobacter sp. IK40]MEB3793213.1 tripartite tricarboxylate transporter TctB family protein [Acinetobacter sp. IK40]